MVILSSFVCYFSCKVIFGFAFCNKLYLPVILHLGGLPHGTDHNMINKLSKLHFHFSSFGGTFEYTIIKKNWKLLSHFHVPRFKKVIKNQSGLTIPINEWPICLGCQAFEPRENKRAKLLGEWAVLNLLLKKRVHATLQCVSWLTDCVSVAVNCCRGSDSWFEPS